MNEEMVNINFSKLTNEVTTFLGEKISTRKLAEYCGFQPSYLNKCFKRESMEIKHAKVFMGTLASLICDNQILTDVSHNVDHQGRTVFFPKEGSVLKKFDIADKKQSYTELDERAALIAGMEINEYLLALRMETELRYFTRIEKETRFI